MWLGSYGLCYFVCLVFLGNFGVFKGRFGRRGSGEVWQAVPLCLMWCVWRENNEGQELSVVKLKYFFFKTLFEWTLQSLYFVVEGY